MDPAATPRLPMANPYIFMSDPTQPQQIDYDDCNLCCCCGIKLPELRNKYRDAIVEITGTPNSTAETLKQLSLNKPMRSFEPLELIVALYKQEFYAPLETCLSRKKNPVDCVYGCYSGIVEPPKPHPHQRRVYYLFPSALPTMAKLVESSIYSKCFKDFDDIIEYLQKEKELRYDKKKFKDNTCGFGKLSIYDAALRLAWHSENREELLPKKVYLHNGTYTGAVALSRFGIISAPGRLIDGKTALSRDSLPSEFQELEPYHIENLLCIFHPIFEDWSPDPKKSKNK